MSILGTPEASPGRVRAVLRHLLSLDSQRQRSELLEGLLSPSSLPVKDLESGDALDAEMPDPSDRRTRPQSMIGKVLIECEKMRLVLREEGDVILNPELRVAARSLKTADVRLPLTLAELLFDQDNPVNHDLARVIAWYLMQDALNPPSNETSVHEALRRTPVLHERFGLDNISYGQFEDWVCFLGFAWAHASTENRKAITPDPTSYLRTILEDVFSETEGAIAFASLTDRIARRCPVLEGGAVRREVEQLAGVHPEPNTLSEATSQAWLRLEEDGRVELVKKSDAANPVILNDGGVTIQVADVRLVKRARASRRRT